MEDRGQRTEVRDQRTDVRGQKSKKKMNNEYRISNEKTNFFALQYSIVNRQSKRMNIAPGKAEVRDQRTDVRGQPPTL